MLKQIVTGPAQLGVLQLAAGGQHFVREGEGLAVANKKSIDTSNGKVYAPAL